MMHPESNFQIAAVRMLRTNGYYCFSVPNGQRLERTRAKIAVAEGLLAGVSDIIILLKLRPVFVEFKSLTGKGRQSADQKAFQKEVEARGYEYAIWNSWEQVEAFINANRSLRQ